MSNIRVGTKLYGFCGGFFGRDDYNDKRVEAIGTDWVVVRYENGGVGFASFADDDGYTLDDLEQYTAERVDEY